MNESMTLSVVIPVYDEHATILELLRRVAHHPEVYEMVIVDDCSADGTAEVLRQQDAEGWPALLADAPRALPRIVFLQHEINQGKGCALRTGFAAATGDIFLTQDADLEYDPQDYAKLLVPLYDGRGKPSPESTTLALMLSAPRAYVLAYGGQSFADVVVQHALQPQSH